jgi:arabinose-5-phosphate isomerase
VSQATHAAHAVPTTQAARIVATGRRVVRAEREALEEVERRLGDAFADAVALIADCGGRVLVCGVGKSGLIGRKIAATLTSTGTPAMFLHPVESVHGDLGIVGPQDVAILISKSGTSDELLALLEHLKRFGVRSIALTGEVDSPLGRDCDVALDAWVREEACPHGLAPTTSTTAALALGDALAVALLEVKGFRSEDFARLHPGGALGRRLRTRVRDVMLTADVPVLGLDETVHGAVIALAKRRGIVIVVDDAQRLQGVFTSGDLTRLMEHDPDRFMKLRLGDVMNRRGRTARAEELATAVVYRMEQFGIMAMPVVDDDDRVVGVVHLHDLLRAAA